MEVLCGMPFLKKQRTFFFPVIRCTRTTRLLSTGCLQDNTLTVAEITDSESCRGGRHKLDLAVSESMRVLSADSVQALEVEGPAPPPRA